MCDSIVNRIEFTKNIDEKFISIKVPLTIENQIIIERFLYEFERVGLKELCKNWLFDEKNYSVISPNEIVSLTKREFVFIKLLLKNKIVKYEQMMLYIWEGKSAITQNAIKLFVKNLKKKLPPSIIKNINGVGYRLVDIDI